ncbi:MAG TPA: hypothetical protein P5277_02275 [Candidatus Paceibacterota bacterium]|nr:hypothetical protein [Candidatus Paceibacterota bacterium]
MNNINKLGILSIFVASALLVMINFISFSAENRFFALSSFVLILSVIFLGLIIINKNYNHMIGRINPVIILIIVYIILAETMLFGSRFFSIEWAFLIFVGAAVLAYDFKIDSRYLILPSLLLLGYIPFLLTAKQNAIAETTAVYVYYFLVIGVVMQIFENMSDKVLHINFDNFIPRLRRMRNFLVVLVILSGFIAIDLSLINRIKNFELWRWTSVYIFIIFFVFYLISQIKQTEFQLESKEISEFQV